jgi:hypothetical protein
MAAADWDLLELSKRIAAVTPGAKWVPTEGDDGQIRQGAWVPYGPGYEIPVVFTYEGEGPFQWRLIAAVIDGRPQCLHLSCDFGGNPPQLPRPITPEALHRFPLGRLLEEATLMVSKPAGEIPRSIKRWDNPEQVRRERASVAMRHRKRPNGHRHHRLTDDYLAEVAEIYRQHVPTGKPSKAVAEHFHYSHSSARRVVREARRRGFLGPARPGRGGEQPKEDTNG